MLGLRREEVAIAAGVSPDYYTRLEQGRQANVSDSVLDALARVLRLDAVEHAHLHDLASPPVRQNAFEQRAQRADRGMLRLMNALGHLPVLLIDRRGTVLASNRLLASVLGTALEPGSSFPDFLFFNPIARTRIINWEDFASGSIAALRREVGRAPDDRALHALVHRLRTAVPDADRWWRDQMVKDYASVTKRIEHPVVGGLEFLVETVSAPEAPDQRLIVYTVSEDSETARMLPILASWGTDVLMRADDSVR